MLRKYLFVVGLFLLPALASGQVSGSVSGDGARPLEAAAVQVFDHTSGQSRYAAVTGADGRFEIPSVAPGRYYLLITHLGYAPHRQDIEVGHQALQLSIVLSTRALESEAVVVGADRARRQVTPITHANVTARDLELMPSMKDLPANLRRSASVTHYSESGHDMGYVYLRLRGFGQRRIAVAINGIPQNDPEEHSVFWINFFDLQGSIRDIQIQRGAGSAFYGSAGIGGAINVVATPYEPRPYARLEVGGGSYNTQRYTVQGNTGLVGGRYVAFVRMSRLTSDGYRDWSWSRFWRLFAGVTRYGDRHTLTLQGYGGPQNDALAYVGIPKAANTSVVTDDFGTRIDRRYNFSEVTRDEEWFHQPHAELIHTWTPRSDMHLKQTLFYVAGVGHFDFGGTFRSADYLRLPDGWRDLSPEERSWPLFASAPDVQVLFRAALNQYQVGWLPRITWTRGAHATTVGMEVRLHRSLRWGRTQEATGLPASVVGADQDYRVYSFRGEKVVASMVGSHHARVHERLALQADVQLTWRRYRTVDEQFFGNAFKVPYMFVNPRVGLTLNPERPLSAYFSVALANREPRMKTLYDGEEAGAGAMPQFRATGAGMFDYQEPLVRPERLVDVELGAQLTRVAWRAGANLYLMQFTDEIVPSGGLDQFGVPRTGNAERTRHIGLELEAAARLARGLDVYGNATLSRSRYLRFVEYVTGEGMDRAGSPIAGFPSPVANLGMTYSRQGLRVRVELLHTGKQNVDNGGGLDASGRPNPEFVVDAYTLVNASVRHAFGGSSVLDGLELSLDVNNALSSRVLLSGNAGFGAPQFFPSALRHIFVGARYTIK